jgi:RepB plasmid partitioning protein/ParB/Sulfiredoxin domain
MSDQDERPRVKLAFERESVVVAIRNLVPLRALRPGTKETKKYSQIVRSIRAIGLVEPPVVAPDPNQPDNYFLLDGQLRVEVLRDLGVAEVECIISTDDETYTYNRKVNRIVAVQEHRMIMRAIERGVSEAQIAEALGWEITSVRRRSHMLDGVCSNAAELLKDSPCAMFVFDTLRKMVPLRQVEAAELMLGQNNFSTNFARALLAATPQGQLVERRNTGPNGSATVTSEQIARMERELVNLQSQIKSFEETYGVDNLHLTVAKGYVGKLLANARVARWLSQHRHEYLSEFQTIAEIQSIGNSKTRC